MSGRKQRRQKQQQQPSDTPASISGISHIERFEDYYAAEMGTFCLDPVFDNFKLICSGQDVKQYDGYDCWRNMCIERYGPFWTVQGNDVPKLDKNWAAERDKLIPRSKIQPRGNLMNKLICCFCASGDLAYLVSVYEIGGDESAPMALRQKAMTWYNDVRSEYTKQTEELLGTNANWFADHPVAKTARGLGEPSPITVGDVFVRFDNLLNERLAQLERNTRVSEETLSEFRTAVAQVHQKYQPDTLATPVLTAPEKPVEDDVAALEMEKAEAIFDRLAAKLTSH